VLPDPLVVTDPVPAAGVPTAVASGDVPPAITVRLPPKARGGDDPAALPVLAARARPAPAKRPCRTLPEPTPPVVAQPMPLAPVSAPALTPREAQLLAALAADPGASSAALGSCLGLAAGTVRKALGLVRKQAYKVGPLDVSGAV